MEPTKAKMNLGRQPKPVKVTFEGELEDVVHCMTRFMAVAHNIFWDMDKRDNTITFYSRAIND